MGNSGAISASLGGRYAAALFALANENKKVASVESDLSKLRSALAESAELKALTTNPVLSRKDAQTAIAAVAKSMKLDALTANTLGVLAQNRRLDQLKAVADAFTMLAAQDRGEVTAEVTTARPLTAAQGKKLAEQLKLRVGSDVAINAKVDPAILGGMTVQIGSQLIDNSIKTRLNSLATAMKG
ncbi:F0F1 ATP synthase subunit delta [Sphingorhabdus arenilitoris]|uniref:ATP synthase subunit delta n=1 Tax=Sphingorhabdus arenilitoris TaxID=1490041 RepID=A0ABV8RFE6_9SPHN